MMKLRSILLPVVALAFVATSALAADYPVLNSRAEPAKVTVGDRVIYTVNIIAPDLSHVSVKESFSGDKASTWSLIDKHAPQDTKLNATEWQRSITYTLSPFEVGTIATPQIDVVYDTPNGAKRTKTVPAARIEVTSVLPAGQAKAEMKDVKPPLAMPFPKWLMVVAGVIVAAVVAWIVWVIARATRKRVAAIVRPPKRPDEWALDELQAIERENLIEQKKIKELYTRVTDVLRTYVGSVFSINALDLTTYELLQETEQTSLSTELRGKLRDVLDEADLVKFAKYIPEQGICRRELDRARSFVQESRHYMAAPAETAIATVTPAGPAPSAPSIPAAHAEARK